MAIEATYEPTFRDFLAMNRWIVRRRWRALRCLASGLIALFLASPFLFHEPATEGLLLPYAQSLAVLAPPAFLLAILPAKLYLAARKRWNAAPEIREPRRFLVSEDGIVVRGATFSARVAWPHITGAGCHRGLFILKTNRNAYYLLAERGIPDQADREAFLSLVRRKVSPTFGRNVAVGRIAFREPGCNLDRGA